MTRAQVDAFAATDIAQLRELLTIQGQQLQRARALRAGATGPEAPGMLDELVDGLEINAIRSRQVIAALEAMVFARRTQLGEAGLRDAMAGALQVVTASKQAAAVVISRREGRYRESAQDAYLGDRLSTGAQGTMWKGRSLTPVHTLKYWTATVEEAAAAVRSADATA